MRQEEHCKETINMIQEMTGHRVRKEKKFKILLSFKSWLQLSKYPAISKTIKERKALLEGK